MAKIESCFDCVYSHFDPCQWLVTVGTGWPSPPVCANHPDSPGRVRPCPPGKVCRNYRPKVPTPQGDVKQIPLGEGMVAYVDTADFEWLNQWTWRLHGGYAMRRCQGKVIYMHREIAQPPEGMVVDHLNHNKLDNTRANLRACTHRENAYNSAKRRGTVSRFRGVRRPRNRSKWHALLRVEGKPIYLGSFAEEIEAARAYDRAAVEHHGDSANLNFPEEWPPQRRQQVYSHQAAANRPVRATHASAVHGKGRSVGAGKRKTGGTKKARKSKRKTGKTLDKAACAGTQKKSSIVDRQ